MKISKNTVTSLLLFLAVLTVYIITLCPTIYIGKSAEFVASSRGLSIIKSTTHPLWFVLAKVFAIFSPGNPAYSLNLLSAFFGAWTIAMLYVILANITHNKTTEETSKFHNIPNLQRITALAACLLLAFSPRYWDASVLAGPDTLKAFLFVLAGFHMVKYMFIRKKRYFLFFSLTFGVAWANSPSMLFFLPVLFIILFLWCKEIFDDPITFGLSIILLLIGFFVFVLAAPMRYINNQPSYATQITLIEAFFNYISWHLTDLRSVLPGGFDLLRLSAWVLALILPTFLPLIYLAWKKRPVEGSLSTPSASIVKYFMMLVFLILGIIYLYGYDFFTMIFVNLEKRLPPRFLIPPILISSWMAYIMGYWMVIIAGGRTRGSADELGTAKQYSKPVFIFLAVLAFVLPAASISINIALEKSSKRNATFVRDYCNDILSSCEADSLIIVPNIPDIKGSYSGFGPSLEYVKAYPQGSLQAELSDSGYSDKYIIDIATAMTLARRGRIDMAKYIQSVLHEEGEAPEIRESSLTDPMRSPFDRIFQETTISKKVSKVYSLHNYMIFNPENRLINRFVMLIPNGVLYRLYMYGSPEYSADTTIEMNHSLWENFAINDYKIRKEDYFSQVNQDIFSVQGNILNNYSRLANDTGILCDEQGILKADESLSRKARDYYGLALEYSENNYSAMINLAQNLENTGKDIAYASELQDKASDIREEFKKGIEGILATSETILDDNEMVRKRYEVLAETKLIWVYGLVRDSDYYSEFVSIGNAQFRLLPPSEQGPYMDLQFKMLQLSLMVDPANPDHHIRKARFLEQSQSVLDKISAIEEYKIAIDNGAKNKRGVLQLIAQNYLALKNIAEAEKYLKKAIEEPSSREDPEKKREDDRTAKIVLMDVYTKGQFKLDEALKIAKEINADVKEEEVMYFLKSMEYIFKIMILQGKVDEIATYTEDFIENNPEWESRIKSMLAGLYRAQDKMKEAGRIYEEIYDEVDDTDGSIASVLANLYLEQREWEKVIGLKLKASNPANLMQSDFHFIKGRAYYMLGEVQRSIEEFELSLKFIKDAEVKEFEDAMAMRQIRGRSVSSFQIDKRNILLTSLVWSYYLDAWPKKDTPEGKINLDKAFEYSKEIYKSLGKTLVQNPRTLILWDNYAWLLHRLTDNDGEALSIMRTIYISNPDHPQIIYHYGVMLYKMGNKVDGLELISEGYSIGLQDAIERNEAIQLLKENDWPIPEQKTAKP